MPIVTGKEDMLLMSVDLASFSAQDMTSKLQTYLNSLGIKVPTSTLLSGGGSGSSSIMSRLGSMGSKLNSQVQVGSSERCCGARARGLD